jgi:DNA mismatch repair protein MSH6
MITVPSKILLQGGADGASETLKALIQSVQSMSHQTSRIEIINSIEQFPKSTALDARVRKLLGRCSNGDSQNVRPWDIQETLEELHAKQYYPKASKQVDDKSMKRWPKVLKNVVDGRADLALSSFGASLFYLQRSLIDFEILSMGIVEAYIPPESCDVSTFPESTGLADTSLGDAGVSGNDDREKMKYKLATHIERTFQDENVNHMTLDGNTLHNLEILTNVVDHKETGSLWSKLNFTKTPHGSRMLRAWLLRPLFRKVQIDQRLDAVEELISGGTAVALQEARIVLSKCGDIERLLSRVHSMSTCSSEESGDFEKSHPNQRAVLYETATYTKRKVGDFGKVLKGLKIATQIPDIFSSVEVESGILRKIVRTVDSGGCFPDMVSELDWFFANFDCDMAAKGLFEPSRGIDVLYDEAQDAIETIKKELTDYKDEMCANFLKPKALAKSSWKYANTTPESKDKYMIELPASISVPSDFILKGKRGSGAKQVNKYRTRFVEKLVEDLEQAFEILKERKSKGMQLIFSKFDLKRDLWEAAVKSTALLDALGSLAQIAVKPGYCRPKIIDCAAGSAPMMKVVAGRHPCIEGCMGNEFIPNDLSLGQSSEGLDCPRVLLLSGPNMGVSFD